jgi:hypothetical protein
MNNKWENWRVVVAANILWFIYDLIFSFWFLSSECSNAIEIELKPHLVLNN